MSAGIWDITAEQGATFNPTLTYKDSTGVLVNLTGYTAQMQVRSAYEAVDPAALILTTENGGITLGGAAGTIVLLVTAVKMSTLKASSETTPPSAVYFYDLNLILGAVTTRLLQGKFTVNRGVTR